MLDAAAQQAPVTSRDTLSTRIDEVVVSARVRNRARKYFRRYVRKSALQGWYIGYKGSYSIDIDGDLGWQSQGTYERNHIPGDDANRRQIESFKLQPFAAADSVHSWNIQRYILLASSIAERAATLGHLRESTMSYRGLEKGMNIFLISEPDANEQRGFSTRVMVSDATGIIARSESVSRAPSGIWNVTVDYALFEEFLYPVQVESRFEHLNPISGEAETVKVEMKDITPRRFLREAIPENDWKSGNDPTKVLKKKDRDRLLRM